jgi:hypothetical protein
MWDAAAIWPAIWVTRHNVDEDGLRDECDPDSDNDDLPDFFDRRELDTDGDGLANKHDRDSDDDGVIDGADPDPLDPLSHRREAFGDLDGDGRRDRVWGEPGHQDRGRVMVEYGSGESRAWPEPAGHRFAHGDQAGAGVAIGDFDGDGFDDLAIGAPGDDGAGYNLGAVWIVRGSAAGLEPAPAQVFRVGQDGLPGVPAPNLKLGDRLATGDFDCDGHADLAIGSPRKSVGHGPERVIGAGAVVVLLGSVVGLEEASRLAGHQAHGGFGDELTVGDFDGDGCSELVVAASRETVDGHPEAGAAYLLRGNAGGLSRAGELALHVLVGRRGAEGARFGVRAWALDRDHDGFDDLTLMVPGDGCGAGTKGFDQLYGSAAGLSAASYVWSCEDCWR